MDRLICGDVGYGKTEVAVRAAFKAAMDGKQVAVLVPTTVLAEQHYETFRSRLAHFPLEVRALSRFRGAAEQKRRAGPRASNQIALSAGGPTGVVLDEANQRAYVLTRFDNSISNKLFWSSAFWNSFWRLCNSG